jgi:hypothetical protein
MWENGDFRLWGGCEKTGGDGPDRLLVTGLTWGDAL